MKTSQVPPAALSAVRLAQAAMYASALAMATGTAPPPSPSALLALLESQRRQRDLARAEFGLPRRKA